MCAFGLPANMTDGIAVSGYDLPGSPAASSSFKKALRLDRGHPFGND